MGRRVVGAQRAAEPTPQTEKDAAARRRRHGSRQEAALLAREASRPATADSGVPVCRGVFSSGFFHCRQRLAAPASAHASTSTTAPAPVAASCAAPQSPTLSQPIQPPPALASALFPFMRLIEHPDSAKKATRPRLAYVSLSADLRLLYADSPSDKPTSLVDFRSADVCLALTRMAYEPPQASSPALPLDVVVAPRVRPETHPTGPAVRITHKKRSILLIAATEEERDSLLSAFRLRVAPWPILRRQMEADMRAAAAPSTSALSLADAARELLSGAAGESGDGAGSTSDAGAKGREGVAKVVWEKAGTVAQMSLWAATLGQGLGGVVRTAEELEKLSKPLRGLTVVGCAFSLVALSARAVSLMGMEHEGRNRLSQAREDLREASVSLVGWLFSILRSGFNDEDGLVGKVFDVLGECWDGAAELEEYLLRNWAMRVWNAEDVAIIVSRVDYVRGKLLAAGLLNLAAKHERRIGEHGRRIGEHESRIGKIECQSSLDDKFRPYAPPFSFDVGLVANAATRLAQLKTAILPTEFAEGSTSVSDPTDSDSSSSLRRVALASVNGEGGVGKTSTCKLLCVDEEVRAYFSDGAILWIDVGKDATEEKVKCELGSAVLLCGGDRSAKLISSSRDVRAAVEIARLFFSKRRVLVVADNVWETPSGSSVLDWAASLSSVVTFPGSVAIMTTRFRSLSECPGFNPVHLGRFDLTSESSPDWRVAEELYDGLLEVTAEEKSSEEFRRSRRKVLEISCGLSLAIRTFAALMRRRQRLGDNVESVLSKIEQRVLRLSGRSLGTQLKSNVGHTGLYVAMEESLTHLDVHDGFGVRSTPLTKRKDVEGKDVRFFRASYDAFPQKPLSARYAALEVMPAASTSLSFPVLRLLWQVPTVTDAEEIALIFENVGLGRIENSSHGQERLFSLHDLQYDYCVGMRDASADHIVGTDATLPASVNGHALFLSSCQSLLQVDCEGAGVDGDVGLVQFCFGDTPVLAEPLLHQYISQNLFRHLRAAAVVHDLVCVRRTIMSVLADFRWLRGRIAENGISSALLDCNNALASRSCVSACSRAETRLLTSDAENSIRALLRGLMLVGEGVSFESDGMLAGALVQLSLSSAGSGIAGLDDVFLNKLAYSSESAVRGPWVKPISGCSRARDQGVLAQAVVGSGACVNHLAALGDGAHFVSGSADGALRIHENKNLCAILELKEHANQVNCVDLTEKEEGEGSFLLFSGSQDGTVRSWEVEHDIAKVVIEKDTAVVGDCGCPVLCLSVSQSGYLVAAGCQNGLVFIWKRRDGDAALLFEPFASFRCSEAEGELGSVSGVAVSRSGNLVVADAENGGIVFWSSGGIGMDGDVYRYCASRLWDGQIGGVALLMIEMGIKFSGFGCRGAVSLDGGLFLWASRDRIDLKWRGKVINLGRGSVVSQSEARHSDWDAFFDEMMSGEVFGGREEVGWAFGAVYRNRSVGLRDADSGKHLVDVSYVSSGTERGYALPRIDWASRSARGGTMHATASFSFDSIVWSIAAGWTPRGADCDRRAFVACQLRGRSYPAILHFYSAKN